MALVLKHATPAQLRAEVRQRYRDARGEQAAKLAGWILDRVTDGTFTDAQVRTQFGLTAAQWAATKARMQTLRNNADAVRVAQGE